MSKLTDLVAKINNCIDDVEYRELMEEYYKLSREQLGIAEEKTDSTLRKIADSDYSLHLMALLATIAFTGWVVCFL